MLKVISILALMLFCQNALAQEAENFSENDLPNVSVDEAPVKKLEVNKSTSPIVKTKESIKDLLLTNKIVSLMFSKDQNDNIERALDAFNNHQEFVPEETAKERAANASKLEEEAEKERERQIAENAKSFVYLASIIYFTSNDWAVWINDKKITYRNNDPDKEISLVSVRPGSVKVTWKLSVSKWRILSRQRSDAIPPNLNDDNQVEVDFELMPNQTFSLNTSEITEGRALIALLKKAPKSETSK